MIPFPNDEESTWLKNYIILPFVIQVLERDKKVLEATPLKFQRLYLQWLDQIKEQVHRDFSQTRKKLRKTGIHVYEEKKVEKGIEVRYTFRRYHHDYNLLWMTVKSFVE